MLFELFELRPELSGGYPLQCLQLAFERLIFVAYLFKHHPVQFREHVVHYCLDHLVAHLRISEQHFVVVELLQDLLLHAILKVLEDLFDAEVFLFIPQDLSHLAHLLQSAHKPLNGLDFPFNCCVALCFVKSVDDLFVLLGDFAEPFFALRLQIDIHKLLAYVHKLQNFGFH